MYLLYDVLRLRKASLGYKLLAKRRDWNKIQDDLNSLTVARIREAIDQLSNRQPITDSTITALLRNLRSVGTHEPLSFAQKLTMREEMKAVIVRLGMIAWWLTVNPSDLSHPLVLELAGISFSHDRLPRLSNTVRRVVSRPLQIRLPWPNLFTGFACRCLMICFDPAPMNSEFLERCLATTVLWKPTVVGCSTFIPWFGLAETSHLKIYELEF
jgi:hypothetical protein